MGFLIGAPSASGWSLSTWGKLRRAVGQFVASTTPPVILVDKEFPDVPFEDFNVEYTVDLVSGNYYRSGAVSNGWLKGGFNLNTPTDVPSMFTYNIPHIFLLEDSSTVNMDVALSNFDEDSYLVELTGQTVIIAPAPPNDTFVITAAMLTAPPVNVPSNGLYPIISIGGLVQIT